MQVLQRMGYLDDDRTVTMKGRGAHPAPTRILAFFSLLRLHAAPLAVPPPPSARALSPPLLALPPQGHARTAPPPPQPPPNTPPTPHPHMHAPPVACEVNSGDELVATELIFGGVLADLEPEEAVALLSALVFQVGGKVGWVFF